MLKLLEENYCGIEIDLSNYYSKKDVDELLAKDLQVIKHWFSFAYLDVFNAKSKI